MQTTYTAEQVAQLVYCATFTAIARVENGTPFADALNYAEQEADQFAANPAAVMDEWGVDFAAFEAAVAEAA